jgi:hypothetical protein
MKQLQLSAEEQRVLAELLEDDIGDLRMEIADTDNADYREMLKQKERVMKHILAELLPLTDLQAV